MMRAKCYIANDSYSKLPHIIFYVDRRTGKVAIDTTVIINKCPYCDKTHVHGLRADDADLSPRVPHCHSTGRPVGYLLTLAKKSEHDWLVKLQQDLNKAIAETADSKALAT